MGRWIDRHGGAAVSARRPHSFLTVAALAHAFLRELRATIGAKRMAEVARLNAAERDPGVCHSHDFCDANMVMDDAFRSVVGRGSRVSSVRDAILWTRAWNLAKEAMRSKA